jgi:hypothetical protein
VVEALLIGGLVAAGGERAEVAAAVLLFRVLTWLLPVPIGGLTYLAWCRRQSRRSPQPATAPPPSTPDSLPDVLACPGAPPRRPAAVDEQGRAGDQVGGREARNTTASAASIGSSMRCSAAIRCSTSAQNAGSARVGSVPRVRMKVGATVFTVIPW